MIIIIIGNRLRAYGFYSDKEISVLTRTLYWVILPSLVFRSTYIAGGEILKQKNLFIAANLCYILTTIIAWGEAAFFVHKGNRPRIAAAVLSAFRGNNLYLGFPVLELAMGATGIHEGTIYLAVTNVSYQLISVASGEIALNGRLSKKSIISAFKNLVKNPMIIACISGVTAALTGIHVPNVFNETMELINGAATPVALIALGGTLKLSSVSNVIRILRRTWFDSLIKLLISPAIMLAALVIFPVNPELDRVTVMLSTMPTAVNCFIMARGMGMDADYAADLAAATTILSVAAIPLWADFLGIVK